MRHTPSSIGRVESSIKKSLECSTKPRPVSTGPPNMRPTAMMPLMLGLASRALWPEMRVALACLLVAVIAVVVVLLRVISGRKPI